MGNHDLARRDLVACLAATASLALVGCGQRRKPDSGTGNTSQSTPARGAAAAAAMTVYRDPSCGCCEAWAAIARDAGYQVKVVDHPDMPAVKRQNGVPEELASCHTALVGGYAVEGHVPLDELARLLKERPSGIKGIAVPGMPLGSPGMEVPHGTKQPFKVMAFDVRGRISVFRG